MNDPNACRERLYQCHCVLPTGHDGPHECTPDPVCGGVWMRHPDDAPGMMRVFRYPSARPGCDAYESLDEDLKGGRDPAEGEYILEHDGIFRAPRGGITFLQPPTVADLCKVMEQRLLDEMRESGA